MSDTEVFDGTKKVKRHGGNLAGVVVTAAYWQPANYHVRIADSLHFVHVIALYDRVKQRVEVIKKVNNLQYNKRLVSKK